MRAALLMLLALLSAGLGVGRTTPDRSRTARWSPAGPPAGEHRERPGHDGCPDRSGCLPGCRVTDPHPGDVAEHFCITRVGMVHRTTTAFGRVPGLAVEVDRDPDGTRSVVVVPIDGDGLPRSYGDPIPLDPDDVGELIGLLAEAHALATR